MNTKTKKETIIRTLVLIVALVNQILVSLEKSVIPIENEQIEELVTLSFTVGASLWAWWKNNSFTHKAKIADMYLNDLKKVG